jgi:sterol-4alpha-carboxylate 3-dehydrogenase (decarboxylating)
VNVAHAHLLAADALLQTLALSTVPLDTERVDGEAFFITNGTPIYFWDFARRVWKERGLPGDQNYNVNKVIVLGTTVAMIIATLLEIILGFFGLIPNFTRIAVRSSAMTRYFSIEKARLRLKYEPIFSVEEGIKRGVKDAMIRLDKKRSEEKTK